MMDQLRKLVIRFDGAKRKGVAFSGWAGPVVEWNEKSAPKVEFGKWQQDKANSWNGGSVSFEVKPYALVMWGANGPGMRSCDKTTKFAFAGLGADGKLFAAPLPKDCDARLIFNKGGWQPPSIEVIAKSILDVEINPSHPSAGKDAIMNILDAAREQLGLKGELSDMVNYWPHLTVIHEATTKRFEEWEEKRAAVRTDRQDRLEAQVNAAIDTLIKDGVEPSIKNVAEFIQPNNYQVYNKIKRHCRHLFDQTNTG